MTLTPTQIFDCAADSIRAAGFGDSATFTPAVGDAVTLYVDLLNRVDYQPGSVEAQVWGSGKTVEYLLDDIGREVNQDESFSIDGTIYTVQWIEDNDGRFVKAAVTG